MKALPGFFRNNVVISYLLFNATVGTVFYFSAALFGFDLHTLDKTNAIVLCICCFAAISVVFLLMLNRSFKTKLKAETKNAYDVIHRYEALSNATNDAIWDYDIQSEKTFYNDRLLSIFGYTQKELIDNTKWWQNNIHPDDRERVVERIENFLKSEKSRWEDEYRFRCKNGDYKIVYDRSSIQRDENGKPVRLIGAMKDITRLRLLENEALNMQLNTKNTQGKNIIHSHEVARKKIKDELQEDVNQILTSIKLFINSYQLKNKNEIIATSVKHLEDAIVKIKNISHTLSSSTFEILGLIEGIKDLFVRYENTNTVEFFLDAADFNEDHCEKGKSLLLYRIIEEKLALIISHTKTKKIEIELSSNIEKTTLKIIFKSIENQINMDHVNTAIISMLSMYESSMQVVSTEDNIHTLSVII